MSDHYIECADLECEGCLPSDDAVSGLLSFKDAHRERRRRKIPGDRQFPGGPKARDEAVAVILADADDYRARSTAARSELLGEG